MSTMEAEYVALSDAVREFVYLKRLLNHIGFEKLVKSPRSIFCDNQSAIYLAKNAVFHKRSKHIDVDFHYIRELVKNKCIQIDYLKSECMPADIFTKSLQKCKHENGVKMLRLYNLN